MASLAKVKENVSVRVLMFMFVLLFLRIFLGLGVYLMPEIKSVLYFNFRIGTYLSTVLFIMLEYDTLREYHFDKLAIIVILLIKPVLSSLRIYAILGFDPKIGLKFRNELYLHGIFIVAGILGLVFVLRRSGLKPFNSAALKWIVIGFSVGLLTAFLSSWAEVIGGFESGIQILLKDMPFAFLTQLTNAAVYEEPLFRGILWGVMKKSGFDEKWIWITQAALFFFGHIYYVNVPMVIWIRTFFCGLVFGAVAWKSRSLTASMTAHATVNSFGQLFSALL